MKCFSVEFAIQFLEDEPSWPAPGLHTGRVFPAVISRCSSEHGFNRDALTRLLIGQYVEGLGVIRAVESFAIQTLCVGAKLGVMF